MDARIGIEELQAHAAALSRLARRVARDGPDADDLVQDTWLRALVQPPHANASVRSLRAWLGTVLRNRHREVLRSKALQHEHESAAARADHVELDPGELEERLRLQSALACALHELPGPMRAAVTLRYLDGHSGPEVARMLGVSHDALRQRLSRGLSLLRERLDRELGPRDAWMLVALGRPSHPIPTPPTLLAATLMSTSTKFLVAGIACVLAIAAIVVWNRALPIDTTAKQDVARPAVALESAADRLAPAAQPVDPRRSIEGAVTSDASAPTIDREHDLFGTVVDPDGSPVAGASVRVMRNESSGWWIHDVAEFERFVPIAAATTDVQGHFAFPLERGRPFDLFVDAIGFAPAHLAQRNAGEGVTVRLGPSGALDVSVVRADGTPLTEGRVEASTAPQGATDEHWTVRHADLDAHGHALLADLPCTTFGITVVPADSTWPTWGEGSVTAGTTTPVAITLPAGGEVRGRVVDARTQRGVAGARVGAARWFGRGVMTDSDGAFVLPQMSSEVSFLNVYATGYAEARVAMRNERDELVSPITVTLLPGRSVRGRVLDVAGSAVTGAYVAASGKAWSGRFMQEDWIGARTDESGRFELAALDPSLAHALIAHKDGLGAATFDLPAYEVDSDTVEVGDIVLRPPAWIGGRVLDESGAPLAGARVLLTGSNADRAIIPGAQRPEIDPVTAERHLRTDDLGRFAFADVAPGKYALRAEGDETHPASEAVELAVASSERRDDVDLHCVAALTIRGHVLDADGQPASGMVRCVPVGPHVRSFACILAEEGAFELLGLQAGPHTLMIEPKDGAPTALRVEAGTQDVDVRLPENDPVRGRVLDPDGKPVAGAWVQLVDVACDQTLSSCESHADGTFQLALAKGAHAELRAVSRKRADGSKLRAQIEDVRSGGTLDVKVVLPP